MNGHAQFNGGLDEGTIGHIPAVFLFHIVLVSVRGAVGVIFREGGYMAQDVLATFNFFTGRPTRVGREIVHDTFGDHHEIHGGGVGQFEVVESGVFFGGQGGAQFGQALNKGLRVPIMKTCFPRGDGVQKLVQSDAGVETQRFGQCFGDVRALRGRDGFLQLLAHGGQAGGVDKKRVHNKLSGRTFSV